MNPVRQLRTSAGVTQAALARAAGTSQPTIAAYEANRKSPSIATIERLASSVGLAATVEYHPAMTREERRSLALHRAIAERLMADPGGVLARARVTLRRMLPNAADSQPLREWRILLKRPLPALLEVVLDPGPWARELRHQTPFAGILSAAERSDVYRQFAAAEGGA
jgi:transcriptional regulator with XRE-family HTH domain